MENKNDLPKLLINLDVNKTLVLVDKTNYSNLEACLVSCFSENAWGTIDKLTNSFQLYSTTELSVLPPKEGLISYYTFVKNLYKSKTEKDIPNKDERYIINEKIEHERKKIKTSFVYKGQPGEKLYPKFQELLSKVKIPQNVLDEINKSNSKYEPFYKRLFSNGYIFLFPSLFRLMIELHNKKRNFSLIFRTFGEDFDDLILEYNSFCEGKHPIFNGKTKEYPKIFFDGSNNSKDYRIKKKNKGLFYPLDKDANKMILVVGTLKRYLNISSEEELYKMYETEIKEKNIEIIKGGKNIYDYINTSFSKGDINAFVIQDDYEFWAKNNRCYEYGKQLFMNPDDRKIHPIFFDDNIVDSKNSLVNLRNVINGKSLEFDDIINKYIIRNDPISSATDEYYFLKEIEKAEKLRAEETNNKK